MHTSISRSPICHCVLPAAALVFATPAAPAQRVDLKAASTSWTRVNRSASVIDSGGMHVVRLDEAPGMGLLWTKSVDFADGDIDVDMRGRDVFQRSFIGIAFRVASDSVFDAVYLRPFNFAAKDSTRHAHAVQYTSYPGYPWERLRAESPGRYEAAIVPAPGANGWVHLRLALRGSDLQVYVGNAATPTLHVTTLGGRTHGGIGLWVGESSPGDFANLTLHPRQAR